MNNKGFLFTVVTFVLLFSIMLFAKSYLINENNLRNSIISAQSSSRLGMIEEDIISNVFNDLLMVKLESITRGATVGVNFNHSELTNRDYSLIMSNYKDYIESGYTQLVYLDILAGFNNTFKIQPFETIYEVEGQNMSLYFLSPYTNINSITISLLIGTQRDRTCAQPVDDGGVNPTITVNREDIDGWTCSQSQQLNPSQDNDRANGRQFYLALQNPVGYIEVKFGQIDGVGGILSIITSNTYANVTQLDIDYDMNSEKVYLESGSITIGNNKTSKIILAQE